MAYLLQRKLRLLQILTVATFTPAFTYAFPHSRTDTFTTTLNLTSPQHSTIPLSPPHTPSTSFVNKPLLHTCEARNMCRYWRKVHTCGDISGRSYIEMCRPGLLTNTVCPNISDDPEPRKSHFPCYTCIKNEARVELEATMRAQAEADAKATATQQRVHREKHAAEQRAKEERVRREAREKAAREREEEMHTRKAKEEEERKARKEGGTWIESGSGKKSKGRKTGGIVHAHPSSPVSKTSAAISRENRGLGSGGAEKSPKKDRSVDLGGRAGSWGPKKILSRRENGVGTHSGSAEVNGNSGLKK